MLIPTVTCAVKTNTAPCFIQRTLRTANLQNIQCRCKCIFVKASLPWLAHATSLRSFILMNQQEQQEIFYQARILELEQELKLLYKKRSVFGWLRFAVALLTAFVVYNAWGGSTILIISIVATGIALFLLIVSNDTDNKEAIENFETLVSINKNELEYAAGNYYSRYDGKKEEPEQHAYAADLDLFGKASLYQYINRCNAEKARKLLAERLLHPLDKSAITDQQEAVKEMSAKPLWRQQLQALGIKQRISVLTERRVVQWLEKEDNHFGARFYKTLLYAYPVVTLSSVFLYLNDTISTGIFSALVLIFYVISLSISKKVTPTYNLLSKVVSEINVLYAALNWFEKETFESKTLTDLQRQNKHDGNTGASQEIRQLKNILNRFDVRLNVFAFVLLNTFLLWDLWQIKTLEKWKQANKSIMPYWFDCIAQIETINSLATVAFNHPGWCFPVIANKHFTLSGDAIGHPLIQDNVRVNNSFSIGGTAKIDLITGSNMAGKSTFLRSIGINMILAFAGAPVCAKAFVVSPVRLISSMRVTDNLAENTSTFYAELKKLKSIIETVNKHEKVLILLDEILRGTNSLDRHTGSAALIKQLIRKNAVALIATHDVELAKLENDFPDNISNYHFDVQVDGEELYFDYKLKQGICTSLNASLLMKKIGIELE